MVFWDKPVGWERIKKIRGMPISAITKMIESPKTPQRLKDFWAKELYKKGLIKQPAIMKLKRVV